ncbi:MAG: response regulator [Ruminococcaceae bacterium]|nr:response regulator [Oscillospiraceae bacterium]
MLKLLIVDDEAMEITFLEKALDWQDLGITIVGIAHDGRDADELEEQLRPDIIITDIMMPLMNGTELAAKIKARRPEVHFIFVSGHKNFEFAQAGIASNVDGYLLKPLSAAKLQATVEDVVKKCLAEKRERFERETFHTLLNEHQSRLRFVFLESLLTDPLSEEEIARQMNFYNITLSPQSICAIVFRLDSPFPDNADIQQRRLIQLETASAINEIVSPLPNTCFWSRNDAEHVLLINCIDSVSQAWISLLAQSVIKNVKAVCSLSLTAGISNVSDGFVSIPLCYQAASSAADHSFFVGGGQTIFFRDIVTRTSSAPTLPIIQREEIANAAASGNTIRLKTLMEQLRTTLLSRSAVPSRTYVRNVCVGIISMAISNAMQLDNRNVVGETGEPPYHRLFELNTLDDILGYTETFLSGMATNTAANVHGRHAEITARIKDILSQKMSTDISVEAIADEMYLSRGYISHVFKEHTGESINRYLTNERIKRAKLLLQDPSMKITSIAKAVGYDNPTYFSSIFRNEVGISPKEYRSRFLISGSSDPNTGEL